MLKTVSILGCGWYGLALAKQLIIEGYQVNGSCTSSEKTDVLLREGINTYIVKFEKDKEQFASAFFNTDVLIICIPPKRSAGQQSDYPDKITRIINAAKGNVKNILFISSTSVYGDQNLELSEADIPNPDTASGKAMLLSEQLLQNEDSFNTTIIRFAGLIGPGRDPGRFFAGKTDVPDGLAPINLIHLQDCIGLSMQIIRQEVFGYLINACSPDHPPKQLFYKMATGKSQLALPVFINELKNWKIITSKYIPNIINYKYQINNWEKWLKEDNLALHK